MLVLTRFVVKHELGFVRARLGSNLDAIMDDIKHKRYQEISIL